MAVERVHRMSFAVDAAAPAAVLYGLVADSTHWPLYVPATVHVERLDFDGTRDRYSLWAGADGDVRQSVWRRTLDAERLRIDFHQEVPAAPVTSTGGSWTVDELAPGWSRLTLEQYVTIAGNRASDVERTRAATEADSRAALARFRELAERWDRLDGLRLAFEDSVRIEGPVAEPVYAFLYDIGAWPGRVPHIVRADVTEDRPGIQRVATDTLTLDGSVRTADSVRLCFPAAGRIVHKQTRPTALLAAHTGEWSVLPDTTGVTVVSQHEVLLDETMVERVLGPDADLEQARRHVREALGRESEAVLRMARQHARDSAPDQVRALRVL
ncbi:aromatase/cyclase [Streptomyces sp. NBC_00249]|uniref:aromatase/cyclase n=1 Tax=Streptomyces sp. NBC_00249 TaxID=2975690 RepID=UPI0022511059|nr:aromatase/cyclase [Streptomyces sp. NBC_00249]MCX5199775.1 aromatase/cyclase [Streptomyces sp. NBC_00249]